MCIRDRANVRVRLVLFEFSHQILVLNNVDEMILDMDIMNAYGFVVNLIESVLKDVQEKIKHCMAKMTGPANHSIKQVALDVYKRQILRLMGHQI